MAAWHFAASNNSSLSYRRFTNPPAKKPLFILSSLHTCLPLKPTTRKNYLRLKLLKTTQIPKLQETYRYPQTPQQSETEPTEASDGGGIGVIVVDRNVKNPIFKYGLWLVGSFVLQALLVACFLGSNDDDTAEISNRGMPCLGGNGKYGVPELEMKRRLEEIRVMASDARKKERYDSKKSGSGFQSDEEKHVKTSVEDEVDSRLAKLRKTLANAGHNVPRASLGYLRNGELDRRVENEELVYRKKYKFKGLPGDPRERPRGFISSDHKNINEFNGSRSLKKVDELFRGGNDAVDLRDEDKVAEQSKIGARESDVHRVGEDQEKGIKIVEPAKHSSSEEITRQRGVRNQGIEKAVRNPKVKNNGKPAIHGIKLRSASKSDTASISKGLSNSNGSLKPIGFADVKSEKKQKHETGFWWLKLPYVLCVLMQQGNDGEGGQGLYNLNSSGTEDRVTHVVAFEDRVDATNFCYVLKTFFKDLEHFKAEVVPVTVKELIKEVKTQTEDVFVVKRGQLKLYAGQPLVDAEMALRSIVKSSELG